MRKPVPSSVASSSRYSKLRPGPPWRRSTRGPDPVTQPPSAPPAASTLNVSRPVTARAYPHLVDNILSRHYSREVSIDDEDTRVDEVRELTDPRALRAITH